MFVLYITFRIGDDIGHFELHFQRHRLIDELLLKVHLYLNILAVIIGGHLRINMDTPIVGVR